jgi:hypothetical protein
MMAAESKTWRWPTCSHCCQSGFTTLSSILLLEQPAIVYLLERAYVSRMLAIEEYDGDEGLRGSDRQSVTPYIHRRICVVLL